MARILIVLLGFLFTMSAPNARAAVVTYDFTAVVTFSAGLVPGAGTSISGSLSYDTDAADTRGSTRVGRYPDPAGVISLSIGSFELSAPTDLILIHDDVGFMDLFHARTPVVTFGSPFSLSASLSFYDFDMTALTSDALGLLPALSLFDDADLTFGLLFYGFPIGIGEADITSFTLRQVPDTPTQVPEPATLVVLGSMLFGLAFARRHARRLLKA